MKLTSARKAIHDATALHLRSGGNVEQALYGCRIQKSGITTSDDIIQDAVESGYILSCIDKQTQACRYWLLYAYAADANLNYRAFLSESLFLSLFQSEKVKKWPALRRACSVAVDDYKMRVSRRRQLPNAFICSVIQVQTGNFKRDGWNIVMNRIQKVIDDLDKTGLMAVGKVVRKLSGIDENDQ